mmetsp:Transcript_11858/g.34602  ORF Transcript_11858/g.34602 Transcript_11858/m.34602 type:complete len:250 (-) Transcript_11858:76-825(-)
MAGRTIHIIEGVKMNTARWSLKMELEVFGKIDVCHMGDRFNQKEHPAWVKFNTREGAQKAMDAMDTGKVICNGEPIKGEWRKEVAAPAPVGDILDAPELNLTSRDLFGGMRDQIQAKKRSRSRKKSRSRRRSKSRRRSRSKRRSRSRSRRRRRSRSRSKSRRRSRSKQKALEGPVPLVAIEDEKAGAAEKSEHGYCPLSHALVPVFSIDDEDVIKCDICECSQKNEVILRCKPCAYHLCRKCAELDVLL